MGFGVRVYGFLDDGDIRRIPAVVYQKLYDGVAQKPITEFAGKRIKIAFAMLETRNRKAVRVYRVDYIVIGFDSKGYIDQAERREAMQFGLYSMDPLFSKPTDILEQLRPALSGLKYRDKFRWTPTDREKTAIERLALM